MFGQVRGVVEGGAAPAEDGDGCLGVQPSDHLGRRIPRHTVSNDEMPLHASATILLDLSTPRRLCALPVMKSTWEVRLTIFKQ